MTVTIDKSDRDPNSYQLTTELRVAERREHVFEFFADAFQLERITPPWLHFSVQSQRPIEMRTGTLIDYQLRLYGLPIRWRSKISNWDPPCKFVDEQIKGPYREWHHLHLFEEVEGGTLVRDIVHYGVPLGSIMHPLFVRGKLARIFEFRRETMRSLFTPIANAERNAANIG